MMARSQAWSLDDNNVVRVLVYNLKIVHVSNGCVAWLKHGSIFLCNMIVLMCFQVLGFFLCVSIVGRSGRAWCGKFGLGL